MRRPNAAAGRKATGMGEGVLVSMIGECSVAPIGRRA
jgi:hypothetical protein